MAEETPTILAGVLFWQDELASLHVRLGCLFAPAEVRFI